jgi:hypothetical protein
VLVNENLWPSKEWTAEERLEMVRKIVGKVPPPSSTFSWAQKAYRALSDIDAVSNGSVHFLEVNRKNFDVYREEVS